MTGHLNPIIQNNPAISPNQRILGDIDQVASFMTAFIGKDFGSLLEETPQEVSGFANYLEYALKEMRGRGMNKSILSAFAVTKIIAALSLWSGFFEERDAQVVTAKKQKEVHIKSVESKGLDDTTVVIIPTLLRKGDEVNFNRIKELVANISKSCGIERIFLVGEVYFEYSKVLEREPKVRLVAPEADLGPAQARNIGIDAALEKRIETVIFLDDDIILSSCENLTDLSKISREKRSIVSPLFLSSGDTFFDGYHDYDGTLNGVYLSPENREAMLYATTGCLAVPSEVLEAGIRFDEKFTQAAGEDIDFSLRYRRMGYRIVPADHISVTHSYGYPYDAGSIRKFVSRFTRYGRGNRLVLSLHPDYYDQVAASSPRRSLDVLRKDLYIPPELQSILVTVGRDL